MSRSRQSDPPVDRKLRTEWSSDISHPSEGETLGVRGVEGEQVQDGESKTDRADRGAARRLSEGSSVASENLCTGMRENKGQSRVTRQPKCCSSPVRVRAAACTDPKRQEGASRAEGIRRGLLAKVNINVTSPVGPTHAR